MKSQSTFMMHRLNRLLLAIGLIMIATSPSFAQRLPIDDVGRTDSRSSSSSQDDNSNQRESASATDAAQSRGEGRRFSPTQIGDDEQREDDDSPLIDPELREALLGNLRIKPLAQSDFEKYVEASIGRKVNRFGADLLLPGNGDYALPATSTVPPDYVLNVGDMISIALTGSIDGSVDVEIDTDGRVFLPRVGSFIVAGVQYRDLKDTVSAAVGRKFRGFDVTVGITELRGIRVYVTGFANNPGAYSVNSLSTMVNAVLAAGGPSSGGSFRSIHLYRSGRLIKDFDLYDLILRGNRSNDPVLQNEDVLFITPIGQEVAVVGGVNSEAIFEARADEKLSDIVDFAGGASVLADKSRVLLYRLTDLDAISGQEITRLELNTVPVEAGDIVQVLTVGNIRRPIDRQAVIVRIEGEVNAPGNYYVDPKTRLSQVLLMAGGLTSDAFPYGTRLERLSVKAQQERSFDEAIEQLEISVASAPLRGDQLNLAQSASQIESAKAVLNRLRQAEPDGRVILDIPLNANELPGDLILENNDRIIIPARPTTIGVFGAVYRPASFLISSDKRLDVRDYIDRAGGTLRSADKGGIFVVRANGDVISKVKGALGEIANAGDVIFVPVKTESSSIFSKIRDLSTVLFQVGIGAAALVALTR